jgi:hypothetical protein
MRSSGRVAELALIPVSSTALNVGLEAGLRYAAENSGDRAHLGRIVRAHGAGEVVDLVAERSAPPDGIDDVVAYWSGFAHGVGQFLRDHLGLE